MSGIPPNHNGNLEPWSTQGLLNDPVINPSAAGQQQQQRLPYQQQQPPQQSQRAKRPRSTSPVAPSKRSKPSQNIPDSILLASKLQDPKTRNEALHSLLKLSSSPDLNYTLSDDNAVLNALVDIVHQECLDYDAHVKNTSHLTTENDKPVFSSSATWKQPPTRERAAWMTHVQQQLAQPQQHCNPKLLQTILIILRNLSFCSANIRLMRSHDDIWSILIGCLYESHEDEKSSEEYAGGSPAHNLALHSLYTLVNLAQQPQLDVTGQHQVCTALFMENSPLPQLGWGGMQLAKKYTSKEDTVNVSTSMILEIAAPHLIQIWSLFSALTHVLTDSTTPRSVLMVALDLLKECLNQVEGLVAVNAKEEIPSMGAILHKLPRDVIQKCIDLLIIPRLGPDALDYPSPLCNMVARVSALKLKAGYDATVDTDLRDRALDVLVPWLSLDEKVLANKLCFNSEGQIQTRLFDAVVPILTTRVGRNDAPLLATQLLKYMASSSDNEAGMLYIQERVLELASRDARVAQLAFTHLYRNRSNSDGEGESEEESGDDGS